MDQAAEPTIVYTPKSQLLAPGVLLRGMWRDLKASRGLAWRLLVRNISARYRQSALGILWAFIPPIMTTAVFVILRSKGAINIADTIIPYPLFVLTGSILWGVFTGSVNAPLNAIRGGRAMLSKLNFPREALLLAAVGNIIFGFLIKIVLLVAAFIYFGAPLSWSLLFVPLAVAMIILLGMVIGLSLVPVGSLYSDVSTVLPQLLGLWFFLTPVIYPAPTTWPYSLLTRYNPVSPLIIAGRDMMTRGGIYNLPEFLTVSVIVLLAVCVMLVVYRVSLPILIERMSA